MEQLAFFSKATTVFFLSAIAVSVAARQNGACSPTYANAVQDNHEPEFQCDNGNSIKRSQYCDRRDDCMDYSDEMYCDTAVRSCTYTQFRCSGAYERTMCIPSTWVCDGISDCPSGFDERQCPTTTASPFYRKASDTSERRRKAIEWLHNKTVIDSATRKWGPLVHKLAVALYLSDPEFLSSDSSVRKEITYELTIQLLSRINKRKIQGIRSSELASFINAFLVTCTDPREFHGFNLVQELRSRVNKQNRTNPYVLLALCNAGDQITESDVKKLVDVFWSNNREIWTDTQAVALMALSCARNQTDNAVSEETISELAMELKQHQYRNGTVENLHTTLLVMQALYSAEPNEDPNNFDESKALSYILENQKPDGSFGNFLLTYYALPVLSCQSLVNISSAHCKSVTKDEDTALFDLVNHGGSKIRIRYSVWLGVERDLERTLSLRVPTNTSFYRAMEIAAEIDSKFRFDYVVRKRKPYITSVFGILDDPESEQFWFPYIFKDEKPSLVQKSTADVIPENDDHIIMWYRKGNWAE